MLHVPTLSMHRSLYLFFRLKIESHTRAVFILKRFYFLEEIDLRFPQDLN